MADPRFEVEGFSLPKGGLIRDQTFADDTALYLKGTPGNLDKVKGTPGNLDKVKGTPGNLDKA
jgi:hypothetical protein